jgi:trehalose 6-phosphate synthase/trehalose 6-phosphate phosphatase
LTVEVAEKLREFFGAFSGGGQPLLLLDYDGTLAPFRVDRFQARPWAGVRELLTDIQQQGRSRMVVVTGRPAHEIAPLLGVDPPLEVWGLHGAEHLFPDGHRTLDAGGSTAREKLSQLRAILTRDSLGGRFEDKANGAVMHWRSASPHQAKLIEQKTRALFEPLVGTDGLALLRFEDGLELRGGRDKGGAVEAILQGTSQEAPIAYLGDDLTDEAAFRAVNSAGSPSMSVLMRRQWRETQAKVWLRPPVELREFLNEWILACACSH